MATLGIEVDAATHQRIRIAVAKAGVKITDIVRPLVMRELARLEREQAKSEAAAKEVAKD